MCSKPNVTIIHSGSQRYKELVEDVEVYYRVIYHNTSGCIPDRYTITGQLGKSTIRIEIIVSIDGG